MPVGQFKTRRNEETGRLESIPEPERQELLTQAGVPELPAEDPFIAERRQAPEAAEPPPLPPGAIQEETGPIQKGATTVGVAAAATAGGAAGSVFGPVGTAVGSAAAGFLASQLLQSEPGQIGTFEGGEGAGPRETSEEKRVLQQLLDVQRRIAKVGTPTKGEVKTQATGSKM